MKITEISVHEYRWSRPKPITNGKHTYTHEGINLVTVKTQIEEFDPFWFEEPIAPDDLDGHRKLAEATTIPIATGENEYTRYGFRDLIATGAVPIVNPNPTIMGGVTEFMKVAALAQANDVDVAPHGTQDVAPHGTQDVGVNLVAAISNGLILEFAPERMDPLVSTMYHQTLSLNNDGTVSPIDQPGIGVEPNYEVLGQYRVA